jgi:hypothetical protein
MEIGTTMVGKNPTSGTYHTGKKTFHAIQISGVYTETTDSAVTIGSTYVYTN